MIDSDNARDAMGMKLDRGLDLYVDNAVHVTLESLTIIEVDCCVSYVAAPLVITI